MSAVPTNLVNGRIPGESDRSRTAQRLINLFPLPNADPALTDGYNYVQNVPIDQNMHQWLSRVDVNISNNTRLFARYNLQAEEQNFPVGLWWRNANQVPYPTRGHGAEPVALGDRQPDEGLRQLADDRVDVRRSTYIDFPNQFRDPSKVSRSALGYTNPGIYHSGLDQIPSMTAWGNGPTLFNPGGFDPVLFAKKWLISGAQNVTKVAGAHTMKAGAYYEWVNNKPAGQRRLERRADSRELAPPARAATTSRTS